jgi:hypothetical protein
MTSRTTDMLAQCGSSKHCWGNAPIIEVCFITPDPTGVHGEPEITTFPIPDRENTLLFCIFANR